MLARAYSGTIVGIEAKPIVVETHRGKGLPGLTLIGMAKGAVKESVIRVRSALLAHGYSLGTQRMVANLLPAELPKEAASLDLGLAVSLLVSAEYLEDSALEGRWFFGELSLGGRLEPVRGAVQMAAMLRELKHHAGKVQELIVPQGKCFGGFGNPGGSNIRGRDHRGPDRAPHWQVAIRAHSTTYHLKVNPHRGFLFI